MRFLAVLSVTLLAACDFQPPPKKAPAAASPTATAPAPVQPAPTEPAVPPGPPPPAAVVADAGVPPADALAPVTQACIEVSSRIAELLIKDAQDPAQRAALEQERTKIIRRSAEACTRDAWSDASRTCFLKATTMAEMQICGRDLKPPT